MKYTIETRWGGSEDNPSKERMIEVISELKIKDQEHPDTWMTNEHGWTLSFHEKGVVGWSNSELNVDERHLLENSPDVLLNLWERLAANDIDHLQKLQWKQGHGIPPQTKEERDEVELAMHNWHKTFYDKLGDEVLDEKCAENGCGRGHVKRGIFCKIHHFEMIRKVKCPFSH